MWASYGHWHNQQERSSLAMRSLTWRDETETTSSHSSQAPLKQAGFLCSALAVGEAWLNTEKTWQGDERAFDTHHIGINSIGPSPPSQYQRKWSCLRSTECGLNLDTWGNNLWSWVRRNRGELIPLLSATFKRVWSVISLHAIGRFVSLSCFDIF